MSLIERQSKRKCMALKHLVEENVYSPAYALEKLEDLFDNGKVLENDYDELAEWLEEQMQPTPEPETEPETEPIEEEPEYEE